MFSFKATFRRQLDSSRKYLISIKELNGIKNYQITIIAADVLISDRFEFACPCGGRKRP